MPDNTQQNIADGNICPDCGVIPGVRHTTMCGARDSGQEIWPGYCGVPILALQISELRGQLDHALDRIVVLEQQTPQAQRLQYEADLAAADLAESGYDNLYEGERPVGADRHGSECQCPYCYDEAEDDEPGGYDPGPECDDQGGMTEQRSSAAIQDTWGER